MGCWVSAPPFFVLGSLSGVWGSWWLWEWSGGPAPTSTSHPLPVPRPPFTAFNQKELAGKIREGKFRRIPYRYSEELNGLIAGMLQLKVRARLPGAGAFAPPARVMYTDVCACD